MYILTMLLLLGLSAWWCVRGINTLDSGSENRRAGFRQVLVGVSGIIGTFLLFWGMSFWGEKLWFDALGFTERFWTLIRTEALASVTGAVMAGGITALLVRRGQLERGAAIGATLIAAFLGWIVGGNGWDEFLLWSSAQATGTTDPVFGKDVSFYLFSLPLIDKIFWVLLSGTLLGTVAAFLNQLHNKERLDKDRYVNEESLTRYLRGYQGQMIAVLGLLVLLGVHFYLQRFDLLVDGHAVAGGAGWTDIHIRIPLYWIYLGVCALAGIWATWKIFDAGMRLKKGGAQTFSVEAVREGWAHPGNVAIPFLGVLVVMVLGSLITAAVQNLKVDPNEITMEGPYIEYSIDFTRQAFDLDQVEGRNFPSRDTITQQVLEDNQALLRETRLWDWRALKKTFEQFQEIRTYYDFPDVDIDRYRLNGQYRQVMLSPREMNQQELSGQSQNFVNTRLKYTHGYGVALAPVSEFTEDGRPELMVKDIPPQTTVPELQLERPEIYYGETTDTHVYVNTSEKEFDYPQGDKNAYTHYEGTGGVVMGGMGRKIIYGWKFDGTKLLFSGYFTTDSRIMMHRDVRKRVQRVAPFLSFGDDPYLVIDRGKLYWILDGYTQSDQYPYSEHFDNGYNYVRNSVKTVVDAYNGDVKLYIAEPDDPIVNAWQRVFPELFASLDEMPGQLRQHIRYPVKMLKIQGDVYAKYHMTNVEVFYNQEDLWTPAQEKYYEDTQRVEPYYVMWEPPGSDSTEFILMQPFTPRNRDVMIGWMAGRSDGEHYGEILAYQFPKEKRVIGPSQFEAKIDQHSDLSSQITLWNQQGSRVIRGNVLSIPIGETLIHVEPIYLEAETSSFPTLKFVIVMHGDKLSYGARLDEALQGLFVESQSGSPQAGRTRSQQDTSGQTLGQQAHQALQRYLRLQSEGEFEAAGRAMNRLQQLLEQLSKQDGS